MSSRFRPPAMLAKIETTVDIVSGGRLDFGIGAGSRPSHPFANVVQRFILSTSGGPSYKSPAKLSAPE
jgi:hypothetical protein